MKEFARTANGYDPSEVNAFLDQVIDQIEKIVGELKAKDAKIKELEEKGTDVDKIKEKLEQYQRMENTLNNAILMAQKTSDQIKANAYRESELIVDEAKKNANRFVNEALLRAEKIEMESAMLKRNVTLFKRRLRGLIEQQLEMVDDIEKVDF